MRNIAIISACILAFLNASSQRVDIDVLGGIMNYQGDLQPKIFTLQNASPAAAFMVKVGFNDHIYLRGGLTFGQIAAYDSKNRKNLQPRNLSFQSGLQEFHGAIEYRLIKPDVLSVTPYVFVGFGVFHYNPYVNFQGEKVYLQPLSTEGQGFSNYPDRKPYQLIQMCIPYGGGIKWQATCNLNVGLEIRQTKAFTDYLDDVSSSYVSESDMLANKGPLAAELAWRGDEFDGSPYPGEGRIRGNPKEQDWYYVAGLTLGLRIMDCESGQFSLGGLFNRNRMGASNLGGGGRRGRRGGVGCPRW